MSEVSRKGPTNCNATPTTRNISIHYLHFKCHQICHSGEQTTYQPSNEHSRKDTSGCHHALQHHQFTLHQPELPADCTSHSLHSGKSQRFTILYEKSSHACNGLHRCSYIGYTITSCTPSRTSLQNVNTHWGDITFNWALTSFITGHTPLLQIPMHPCFDCRLTVSPTNWCTHTGSHTTQNISSLQFSHTTQKLISMLKHRSQVFKHNLWWNKSSGNFGTAVHYMSTGWGAVFAVLMHLFNHLPTNHHVLQLPMPRKKQGLRKAVLYRSGILTVPPSLHQ